MRYAGMFWVKNLWQYLEQSVQTVDIPLWNVFLYSLEKFFHISYGSTNTKGEFYMGLIKAISGAIGGTFADQWKEMFYCESLNADVLVAKGKKRTSKRSSNKRGEENIISNGSIVVVSDGQCAIITEQGKVTEFCAEPGEYTYDSGAEPSLFAGDLNFSELAGVIGRRFTFGGDTGRDQRIYYFNLKEIPDNKFGTNNPIPFRIVDQNIGLDLDTAIRCNGSYSFKITNPVLFYQNVCGNVEEDYEREQIQGQLRTEFISALQPAFADISEKGIRPNMLPSYTDDLQSLMHKELTNQWDELRGISIISIALNPITLPEEDTLIIKELQKATVLKNTRMAAATLASAQADAMKSAADNPNGAMMGFMGMKMAGQTVNVQNMYAMSEQESVSQTWICSCGTTNSGNFCSNCGKQKKICPKCESVVTGNFCTNCGTKMEG